MKLTEFKVEKGEERDCCQYQRNLGPYSWCDLSDNPCLEDTGNSDFNVKCDSRGEDDEL